MKIDQIKNYIIDENLIINEIDNRHIENYKQLIMFFENSIQNSIKEGTVDYKSLHNSCIQCIRFLDNLIFTYDNSVNNAKLINKTLQKIITDNSPLQKEGNEKNYQTPL